MRRVLTAVVLAAVFGSAAARAQGPTNCVIVNDDACQKAKDMSAYLVPQLSLGLAGGNPVLGSSGVLGKLGRFSVGIRVTALQGTIFDSIDVSTSGRTRTGMSTKEQWIPLPSFDAVIGIFGGLELGVTHIGSLDGLVSFVYVPDVSSDDNSEDVAQIKVGSHTKFGFGARVGLIDEEAVIPGISVSYLRRGLPKITLQSSSDNVEQFGVNDLEIDVATWRIMATKTFVLFALSAGVGGDSYTADGIVVATAGGGAISDEVSLAQKINRTNWFVDLTIPIGPVKLAAEYGAASGGKIETYNTFDPKADASRKYASIGLRLGW